MTEFHLSEVCLLGLMPERGIKRLLGDRLPDPSQGSGVPRAELYLNVEDPALYHRRAIRGWGSRSLARSKPAIGAISWPIAWILTATFSPLRSAWHNSCSISGYGHIKPRFRRLSRDNYGSFRVVLTRTEERWKAEYEYERPKRQYRHCG